jgi:hypothetical protein
MAHVRRCRVVISRGTKSSAIDNSVALLGGSREGGSRRPAVEVWILRLAEVALLIGAKRSSVSMIPSRATMQLTKASMAFPAAFRTAAAAARHLGVR